MTIPAQNRVLVIDDDEVARESARLLLTRWGHEVVLAKGGEEGLEIVRRDPPDLILVDLQMPGISGLHVLHEVHERDPAIICIMVTGYATLSSAVSAMKEGAYDFIPKPFSPNELKLTVERGLRHRELAVATRLLREEKARMEANFVTMVTHQMRSPLAAVRQLLEVVVTETLGPLPGDYLELLGRATGRLDGLLTAINAWLAMTSAAEEGHINKRLVSLSQAELLDELEARVAVEADAAGQVLRLEKAGEAARVLVDRETMLEALGNIASNAVKYNRANGTVSIVSRVLPRVVALEIRDEGPGIPEAERPFIFDDFFRSKSPELKNKPGTGLGLSIAKRVVAAHKGEIEVRSAMGAGTVFTVILPRVENR